ncbi:MAG: hypothetical protein WAW80_01980 [Candidatus Saccharimonadales bacterium]
MSSDARRQREWLDALEATKEAKANRDKAQENLDSTAANEKIKEKALLDDSVFE